MAFIALQGKPGSGKSTMAATITKLGFHAHYIDMDDKVKSQINLRPYLKEKTISYVTCPEPLTDRKLAQIARSTVKESFPKSQPKGYIWFSEYIDNLEKNVEELGLDPSNTVPVIDSLSAVNRHLKNLMRYYMKGPKIGFDGWDTVLQNYEALFGDLRMLTPDPFPHLIINLHTRDDLIKDGENVKVECRPYVDGQFREQLGSYLEEFYFLEVETFGKLGKPKYWAYTKPVEHIKHARSSIISATRVEADFETIFSQVEEEEEE